MKTLLTSAAMAAAMLAPAAFAHEPPPLSTSAEDQVAHTEPQILQGTPEAAAAAKADADRQSVEIVAAKNNGEPVAAEVARVVSSGKAYTTDDLVRAQRVAMNLDPGAPNMAARTPANTTKTPGQAAVFETGISTDKASPIPASATDVKVPRQPETPSTAENTARPEN